MPKDNLKSQSILRKTLLVLSVCVTVASLGLVAFGQSSPPTTTNPKAEVISVCEALLRRLEKTSANPQSNEYLGARDQYQNQCVDDSQSFGMPTLDMSDHCKSLRHDLLLSIESPNGSDFKTAEKAYYNDCEKGFSFDQSTNCTSLYGTLLSFDAFRTNDANKNDFNKARDGYLSECAGYQVDSAGAVDFCRRLKTEFAKDGQTDAEKIMARALCPTSEPAYEKGPFCDRLKGLLMPGGFDDAKKVTYFNVCQKISSDDRYTPESESCRKQRAALAVSPTDDARTAFSTQCETGSSLPFAAFGEPVIKNYTDYPKPFPDLDLSRRDGKAVMELYRRGIVGGAPDGNFHGGNTVNRAEAAKFLLLACHRDLSADTKNRFIDVSEKDWYAPYVSAAQEQQIINGNPDGSFRPANAVNRAEFVKMFSKACLLTEDLDTSLFGDVSASDWFAKYAGIAERYKLFLDSLVDNQLKPGQPMTRSEVAVAIAQYYNARYPQRIVVPEPVIDPSTVVSSAPQAPPKPKAPAPVVSGISPLNGTPGSVVTISGTNLMGVLSVQWNSIPAGLLSVSDTALKVLVPQKSASGKIIVSTAGGSAISPADFQVVKGQDPEGSAALPVIDGFAPEAGPPGTLLTIGGSNLLGVTGVSVGTAAAPILSVSAMELKVLMPDGATSGKISVKNSGGTATSDADFILTAEKKPSVKKAQLTTP